MALTKANKLAHSGAGLRLQLKRGGGMQEFTTRSQIEITPEMIEAGSLALADLPELSSEGAAILAFQAMLGSWLSSDQAHRLLRQGPVG